MPRYIDADTLMKRIYGDERPEIYDGAEEVDWILKCVDDAPTISPDEARGAVRCRECDFWNRWDSAGRESLGNLTCSCAYWTVEDGAVIRTRPTDFCSYGERMVSEDG